MPLVINSFKGGYTQTHMHTYRHTHRNDYTKPSTDQPVASAHLVKQVDILISKNQALQILHL